MEIVGEAEIWSCQNPTPNAETHNQEGLTNTEFILEEQGVYTPHQAPKPLGELPEGLTLKTNRDILEEMDKFSEICNLPRVNQQEIENMKRLIPVIQLN